MKLLLLAYNQYCEIAFGIELLSTQQNHKSLVFIFLHSQWWKVSDSVVSTWNQYKPSADTAEQEPDKDWLFCNRISSSFATESSRLQLSPKGVIWPNQQVFEIRYYVITSI